MTLINYPILLTESETLQETIDCLIQHIPLETQGAFKVSDLYQILVRAASDCDSIENISKSLKKATSLSSLKIDIKTLYLDRGFFSISVIRCLKALRIAFIMPAIKTKVSSPNRGGRLIPNPVAIPP